MLTILGDSLLLALRAGSYRARPEERVHDWQDRRPRLRVRPAADRRA